MDTSNVYAPGSPVTSTPTTSAVAFAPPSAVGGAVGLRAPPEPPNVANSTASTRIRASVPPGTVYRAREERDAGPRRARRRAQSARHGRGELPRVAPAPAGPGRVGRRSHARARAGAHPEARHGSL